MEVLNMDGLPEEAKKELIEHYQILKSKFQQKETSKKLPEGFYNPVEIDSYELIAKREEIYER